MNMYDTNSPRITLIKKEIISIIAMFLPRILAYVQKNTTVKDNETNTPTALEHQKLEAVFKHVKYPIMDVRNIGKNINFK